MIICVNLNLIITDCHRFQLLWIFVHSFRFLFVLVTSCLTSGLPLIHRTWRSSGWKRGEICFWAFSARERLLWRGGAARYARLQLATLKIRLHFAGLLCLQIIAWFSLFDKWLFLLFCRNVIKEKLLFPAITQHLMLCFPALSCSAVLLLKDLSARWVTVSRAKNKTWLHLSVPFTFSRVSCTSLWAKLVLFVNND